ncbi:MAG: SpaH/EbpB family LPXTG-anchored major pilin [Suipraeoptans sp.]
MKKRILTSFSALFMAVVMVLSLVPSVAKAAPTINMDEEGSVTIVKTLKDEADTRIAGVVFRYLKIADVAQVENPAGTVVVAYTNLDSDFIAEFAALASPDFTIGSNDYYYASTISNVLKNNTSNDLIEYITDAGGIEMPATDSDGVTTVDELEVGLYLFVETVWPATITKPVQPFAISIPSNVTIDIDDDYNTIEYDEDWIYDVTAVPKNEINEVEIDKDIVIDETQNTVPEPEAGLSQGEDYQIGDTVKYQLRADVLATIDNLDEYIIGDLLSDGLTFDENSVQVWGLTQSGVYELLEDGVHYDLVVPGDKFNWGSASTPIYSTFEVQMITRAVDPNPSPMVALDDDKVFAAIYIEYNAVLNENAKIWTEDNPNKARLEYSKTTKKGEEDRVGVDSPEPKVYTYEFKFTKVGTDSNGNTVDISDVEFELRDSEGNLVMVEEATSGTPGVYIVSTTSTTSVMKPASDGTIHIMGVDAGQYQIVEIKTATGLTLLKEAIIVNIKATTTTETYTSVTYKEDSNGVVISGDYFVVSAAGTDYYARIYDTATGNVKISRVDCSGYSTGDYVKFQGEVYTDDTCTTQVTRYDRVQSTNAAPTLTSNFPIVGGIITFTVANKSGFDLPETGSIGTYVFTIGGVLIMLAAAVLINRRRKRRTI